MKGKQGFFALIDNKYVGPFDKLNDARSEARKHGSDISIYHGILNDDKFEGSVVPKVIKK